jgi:hypothetical protein
MLGLCSLIAGEEKVMNVWSEYLRTQAVLADRISKTMTTAATVKEFADYAEGFRQDADAEDKTPTHRKGGQRIQWHGRRRSDTRRASVNRHARA